MFDNLGIAAVQLIGFLGVFGFFIYQLFSDNKNDNSSSAFNIKQKKTYINNTNEPRKGFFGRQQKIKEEVIKPKKSWFKYSRKRCR